MSELGSIYGTKIDGSNTLVIDFSNLQINGALGFSPTNDIGTSGQILESRGGGNTPHWVNAPVAGDISDVKIRGDKLWTGPDYTYTGTGPQSVGIRALHFHVNNTNFANPQSSNATLSITDYYGIRIGSPNGATINFPHNHVYFNSGFSQASDDRLKHNETPITDGLSVINQLSVLKYDRAKNFTSREDMKIEVGMIAQEVQTIPQLSHCVAEPMYEEDNYKMVYQDIHNYHIAATQELYKLVLDLQARIAVLEAR